MKRILILAHFCGELDGRLSNRFVYLANLLSSSFEVELITSNFYHTKKKHKAVTGAYSFKITLIDEPGYRNNISFKRMISHWILGKNLERYLKSKTEQSIIYSSFPTFSISKKAYDFSKRVGGKFVLDIQDLWPASFEKYLGKNLISRLIIKFFSQKVNYLYKNSDAIFAVSNTFLQTPKSVVDLTKPINSVYIGATKFPEYNFDNRFPENGLNTIRLLYLGSLGESYDLITAIKAFDKSRIELSEIVNIEFDIIGEGTRKSYFEQYAADSKSTVRFLGLIDYNEVQKIIPDYDIAINPISSWSVASIINKHGDYALASLPVLNTQNSEEYIDLLNHYNCGLSSEPENFDALASNIIKLCKNLDLLLSMRNNSKKMAFDYFDRANTYKTIESVLLTI